MIFCVLMFVFLSLTMIVQEFLPVLKLEAQGWVLETHIFLPWSLFYVLALAVPYPVMLFFALVVGFMWDARWLTPMSSEEADFAFGSSVVIFALFGSFMQGIRPLFRRGHWALPVLMVGLAVLFQLICEYLLINFHRGRFFFSAEVWFKMVFSSVAAMILAPVLLLVISRVAKKCGYQLEFEQFMFRRVYGHQI